MPSDDENNAYSYAERERSKSASLKDGAFWSFMVGSGESYVNPFAIKLGADSTFSGLLQTVPQFLGALTQLIALPLATLIKNRRLVLPLVVILQAFVWVPFAALAWLADPSFLPLAFLLFCAYHIFGQIINPAWSSWMAELVPSSQRPAFFSSRLRISVLVQMLAVFAAGWMLDALNWQSTKAFAILFAAAFFARAISAYFLSRMSDKPSQDGISLPSNEPAGRPIFQFSKSFLSSSIKEWSYYLSSPAMAENRRFNLYVGALMVGTYISSPFFDIFMLAVLGFDYKTWSLLVVAQTISKFIFYDYWGKAIERFGNRAVLFGTGFLIPALPLFWVLGHSFGWLFIAQVFSGLAWSGFELAAFNYSISTPDTISRIAQSAAYNFSKGAGTLIGTLIGGALLVFLPHLSPSDISPYIAVFFVSSMARYAASAYFLPRFSERMFEAGMDGRRFLWQVLAVQPTKALSRSMLYFSASSLQLIQAELNATRSLARKLASVGKAGVHLVENGTLATIRIADAGLRTSVHAARKAGLAVPKAGANLVLIGKFAVRQAAKELRKMQDEFIELFRRRRK
jgi:MFS family permease